MTLAVGLVDNGTVWVGVDSLSVVDGDLCVLNDSKCVAKDTPGGPMLIAVAGYDRLREEIEYRWRPPKLGATPYLFDVAVSLQKHLTSDEHLWGMLRHEDGYLDSSLLTAYDGRLSVIGGDFTVTTASLSRPYMAIGSGDRVALGALFASNDQETQVRLSLALEAAAEFLTSVGPPWNIRSLTAEYRRDCESGGSTA